MRKRKHPTVELTKRCQSKVSEHGKCYSCGREISIFNPAWEEFLRRGKLYRVGRCCSD